MAILKALILWTSAPEAIKLEGIVAFMWQQSSFANAPQCNIVRTLYMIINIIM